MNTRKMAKGSVAAVNFEHDCCLSLLIKLADSREEDASVSEFSGKWTEGEEMSTIKKFRPLGVVGNAHSHSLFSPFFGCKFILPAFCQSSFIGSFSPSDIRLP